MYYPPQGAGLWSDKWGGGGVVSGLLGDKWGDGKAIRVIGWGMGVMGL